MLLVLVSCKKPEICSVVVLQDLYRDGICVVIISLDTPIDSNANLVNGYTFLGEELISCCLVSESCNNNLINEKELVPVSDSIPGYPDIFNTDLDGNYDAPMRIYKIVSADSLQLIKSAFIPN
jgi:hypothetical protein